VQDGRCERDGSGRDGPLRVGGGGLGPLCARAQEACTHASAQKFGNRAAEVREGSGLRIVACVVSLLEVRRLVCRPPDALRLMDALRHTY
jgi:hypothetical protein